MSNIRNYSTVAASNDVAALSDGIDQREGMAARQVNNSSRAEMAALKGFANELPWYDAGHTPTRTGASTFTIPTDVTAIYTADRRLKLGDSSTLYGSIISSSFGAGVTTVTMAMDGSGVLTSSLATVAYSIDDPTNVSDAASFNRKRTVTTGGTSTAYTASFTPKVPALLDGVTVDIMLDQTCGIAPTFAPDGLTAKEMRLPGNQAIPAGAILGSAMLRMVYRASPDKWLIEGIAGPATQAKVSAGTDMVDWVTSATLATAVAASAVPPRSALLNPEGYIFQRTAPTTDNAYAWDRWRLLLGAANAATCSQLTSSLPTNAKNAMRLTVGSGNNNKFGIFQIIEGANVYALRGRAVCLQAQLQATSGIGDVRMAVVSWNGTEDSTSADPINAWGTSGTVPTYTGSWANVNTPANLSVTTSFAQYSVTGTVPNDATNLGVLIWSEDTSTTQTTDKLDITMVQLSLSGAAVSYNPRPYGEELALCQRYCQVLFGANTSVVGIAQCVTTTAGFVILNLPTSMRATPTVSVSAASDYYLNIAAGSAVLTGLTFSNNDGNHQTLSFDFTVASGLTAGQIAELVRNSSSALITIAAEL